MPTLARPDGVELRWEERGEGALVVAAFATLSSPLVFGDLLDLLAEEHRVVTYGPRGAGGSTRSGPCSMETDVADLAALLDMLGGDAILVTTGDGCNRAVRVAARHPELMRAVITPGGNPLGRSVTVGSDSLAGSGAVIAVLVELMRTDYRAALRTAISSANPQLDEAGVRERIDHMVEYSPQDVTLERLLIWIDDVAEEEARAVGDKLWMLEHPNNPWFPQSLAQTTRERLPEAHIELVPDGALSRPDLTADVVRRIVAGETATAGAPGRRV